MGCPTEWLPDYLALNEGYEDEHNHKKSNPESYAPRS
jgi:hypothetical protein